MIASRSAVVLGGLLTAPLLLVTSCGDSATSGADTAVPLAAPTASAPPVVAAPGARPAPEPVARAYAPVSLRTVAGGTMVVAGPPAVAGSTGPVVTYSLQVYRDINRTRLRAAQLADIVAAAFGDPVRGWTATGARRLVRVSDPAKARIQVVLARPAQVDRYCARAGLNTARRYSCFNGRVAALNMWRWRNGAKGFESLRQYRTYVVNHEVGHGLGYSHKYCPGRRSLAPVMQQQTKSLRGCRANAWPYR